MGPYCAFGWACSKELLKTMREAKVKVLISYYTVSEHFKTLTFASRIVSGGVGNSIVCIHLSYVKVGMPSGSDPHQISVITYDKCS